MRAAVEGEVQLTEVAYRGRRQLLCRISDGSGMLTLRFFYFSGSQQANLARGTRLRCFGEVRRGPLGLEIVHPEYRRVMGAGAPLEETLTPIYPLTEGVPQGRLRALIGEALRDLERAPLRDFLAGRAALPEGLPSLPQALTYLHRPPREAQLAELAAGRHPAQQRLAFEELLAHHLTLRLRKRTLTSDPAFALADEAGLAQRFVRALPFAMTRAQARVLGEAERDLASGVPMARLVQGDVGCGKTVVAAAAAARAAGSGLQAAPWRPLNSSPSSTGATSRLVRALGSDGGAALGLAARAHAPQRARDHRLGRGAHRGGHARAVPGRHRVPNLALVIVDEQHRFGVQQRLKLQEKGQKHGRVPHQLIMTATPIPRTLAMTAYADLDISVIDELPPGAHRCRRW